MDSLDRLKVPRPVHGSALASGSSLPRRALVHASLATVGQRGRHLTGTFCLTGDTMEGIIQCLVFLKAFSVSWFVHYDLFSLVSQSGHRVGCKIKLQRLIN